MALAEDIPKDIDISEQPLADAITEFSLQTATQIIASSELIEKIHSSPVSGQFMPETALVKLLEGTGLIAKRTGEHSFILVKNEGNKQQTKEQPPVVKLKKVVVLGEKYERTVFDTVSSVGVVTTDEFDNTIIADLSDVYSRIANVTSTNGEGGFNIRGINSSSVAGGGLGSGSLASLYIDGAVLPGFAVRVGPQEIWDIEQVEVFRGPQSTAQGRNALAGAIAVKSKDPTFDWEATGRFSYGAFDTYAASAAFGGPIIDDLLAFRVAIDHQSTDGYVENITLNDDNYNDNENFMVRGKLLFEPKMLPNLSALLTVSSSNNQSGGNFVSTTDNNGNFIDPFDKKIFSNLDEFENNLYQSIVFDVDYQFGSASDWKVRSITTYNDNKYERFEDDDRSAAGGINARSRTNSVGTLTQELRLHFDTSPFYGHVGGYFLKGNNDDTSAFATTFNLAALGVPGALLPFYTNPLPISRDAQFDIDTKNVALFGEMNFDVTETITVFGGLRYDYEEKEIADLQFISLGATLPTPTTGIPAVDAGITAVNATINGAAAPVNRKTNSDFHAFVPKIGFTLHWNQDLSTSFTVQRGYRSGGSDLKLGEPNDFDPEFTTNYEIALRSRTFNDQVQFSANVFYTDWTDQQVLVSDPLLPGQFNTENSGESELYGFETAVNIDVSDEFNIFANAGLSKTKFNDFTSNNIDFSGNEFPFSPKWTAAAGVSYKHPSNIFGTVLVNYLGNSYQDPQNTLALDARTIVNTKLGYQYKYFTAYIFVRNLFNEEYITGRNTRFTNLVRVGEPRVVGFQIQATW